MDFSEDWVIGELLDAEGKVERDGDAFWKK